MAATLHAKCALLPDGWQDDVAVEIDAAGRIGRVEQRPATPNDMRLGEHALLPAPANLHSHTFQRAMAGLTEHRGTEADSFWTWRTLMYRFLEALTPEDVEAIAAQVFVESLEAGYCAIGEFHYLHHGPDGAPYDNAAEMTARIAQAAHVSGIGLTHLPVLYMQGGCDGRVPAGGQRRFASSLTGFERLIEAAARVVSVLPPDTGLGVAPHSLRAVPPEALVEIAAHPDRPIHIHVAEQVAEVEEIEAALGARPVAWLLDNQEVDDRWSLIHATQMQRHETEALATSGATVGLCPITEANLGDGIFDGAAYLTAGGHFGVGTDSNVRIGLAEELRLLEDGQRLRDRARNVLTAPGHSTGRRLLDGAACGGARALGRESGAIQAGLWADLLALDLGALSLTGLAGDRILDAWLFAGDGSEVAEVWSAGRHMVTSGQHIYRAPIERRFRETILRLRAAT